MNNMTKGTGLIGGFTYLYNHLAQLDYNNFVVLICLMLLDILIGVIVSLYKGEFATSEMKKGLLLKMLILLLLLALTLFQVVLNHYGIVAPFSYIITALLSFMEIASIVEHFAELGVLPDFIISWFEKGKEKVNNGDFKDL